ncbi:hypothetical protein F5H01DRAFT_351855 [Linnemannia elongata]|nr:hypothetical protein F5H01DRAFT_351855 [Linnemannia elongata]
MTTPHRSTIILPTHSGKTRFPFHGLSGQHHVLYQSCSKCLSLSLTLLMTAPLTAMSFSFSLCIIEFHPTVFLLSLCLLYFFSRLLILDSSSF